MKDDANWCDKPNALSEAPTAFAQWERGQREQRPRKCAGQYFRMCALVWVFRFSDGDRGGGGHWVGRDRIPVSGTNQAVE